MAEGSINPLKNTSKPAWIIAGVAGVGVAGYFIWKRLHQPQVKTATTGGTSAYGYGYGSPAGYGYGTSPIFGYGLGSSFPFSSSYGGGYGYGGNPTPTTNAQWFQQAFTWLTQSGNVSTTVAEAALAKYLAGQPVTSDQTLIIQEAEAAVGPPPQAGPNGMPPAINNSGSGGGGNAQNPVTGLHQTQVGFTGGDIAWNPSPGATSYQVTAVRGNVSMLGPTSARIHNINTGGEGGDQTWVHVLAEPAAPHARSALITVHTRK